MAEITRPLDLKPLLVELANNATPTVGSVTLAKTGGTTTITDFDDGVVGQTFRLLAKHILEITHSSNLLLKGGLKFDMKVGDVLTLTMFDDQIWEEVSRKVLA